MKETGPTLQAFEALPKEERYKMKKEFRALQGLILGGDALLLGAVISGGFSVYYMVNIFFTGRVSFCLYICAVAFVLGCCLALLCTSQYHNKFRAWLETEKNISKSQTEHIDRP